MPITDWLADYLRYTDNSEPQSSYRLWTGISTIAAALERKVWLNWDDAIYPNLYVVLVGPPAARKGTAMSQGEWFLRRLGDKRVNMAANSTTFPALVKRLVTGMKKIKRDEETDYVHNSVSAFARELMSLFRGGDDF